MTKKAFVLLLASATGVNITWAGGVTFRVLVDLPARHQLGPLGFADLSRATDLARGLVFYPLGAIGSTVLAVAACFFAAKTKASHLVRIQTAVAALACALVLAVTGWAAPIMFHIGAAPADPVLLTHLAERFALLTDVRAVLADLGGLALLCALSTTALRAADRPCCQAIAAGARDPTARHGRRAEMERPSGQRVTVRRGDE